MKKHIALMLLLCLTILPLSSCGNNTKYTEAISAIEQGDLETAYKMLSELGDYKDANELLAHFHFIPTDGVITRQDLNNGTSGKMSFIYNEDNLLIKMLTVTPTKTDVAEFKYDEQGNLILEAWNYANGECKTIRYTYGTNNRLTSEELTHPSGDRDIYAYIYNEKGVLIRWLHSFSPVEDDISIIWEHEPIYNSKGVMIEKKETMGDSLITHSYYTYDKKGNMIEQKDMGDGDKYKSTTNFIYDKNGNLTKKLFSTNDGGYSIVYTYDDEQRLIREEHMGIDRQATVTEYSYSSNGFPCGTKLTYPNGLSISTSINYKLVYIPFKLSEQITDLFEVEPILTP